MRYEQDAERDNRKNARAGRPVAEPLYDTNDAILTVYSALDGSAEITDLVQLLPAEK